jgi:hypothetical protein
MVIENRSWVEGIAREISAISTLASPLLPPPLWFIIAGVYCHILMLQSRRLSLPVPCRLPIPICSQWATDFSVGDPIPPPRSCARPRHPEAMRS